MAAAWSSLGLGSELLDFFGGASGPSEKLCQRFAVPAIQEGDMITSMRWWPSGMDGASPRHCLILGSLAGRLVIMDVATQTQLRTFSLSPIVLLQLCRYHSQEWLLIETTAEPKNWKLLLAEERSGPPQSQLRWNITDGQALPCASGEHFEMEPLHGRVAPHLLLVVRRATPEGKNEVLGMLVDEEDGQGQEQGLCLLLSLPSFPEDPLARVELPIDVAPPSSAGQRRLVDLVVLLGGNMFLTVLHDGPDRSVVLVTTAKPGPAELRARSSNQVVQELRMPGRVLGACAHQSWSDAKSGGRSLAILWTAAEVFTLTALGTSLADTLQLALCRGVSVAEDWDESLPLLCWALDIDVDCVLLGAGRRMLSGRWSQIGEEGLRRALALWERRSSKEVPLLVLQECFSELFQNVEVMHLLAPGILQVLRPHWPQVALKLHALHRRAGSVTHASSSDADEESNGEERGSQPELANVAWFLSLVVMLLVVLRRTKEGASEYRRGGKSSSKLHEGIAWQAWVSDQVTLIISGAKGRPPSSFPELAEAVQQEFDAWWAQELEAEGSPHLLASSLSPAARPSETQHGPRGEPLREAALERCYSARLLLLGALRRRCPLEVKQSLCSFAGWVASHRTLAATFAITSLVDVLLRGAFVKVTTENGEEIYELVADEALALDVSLSLLASTTDPDTATLCDHPTYLAYGTLTAILASTKPELNEPKPLWSPSLDGPQMRIDMVVPDSDAPLLDQLKKLGQEETLPAGALSPAASSDALKWLTFLDSLGGLGGDACIGCSTTWSWQRQEQMVSFAATEPNIRVQKPHLVQVLLPLETWLMKSCPLTGPPSPEQWAEAAVRPSGADGAVDGVELELLEHGAEWEVPESFVDRLVQCSWWQRHAVGPTLPLMLLALLTVEERWLWELPWTAQFRLHVAHALYIVKSWATSDKDEQT
ncbi:unnamed protein product [Durusdinium trenchii]|uniref:Anaphase-promoting complex subunit 4 n=1 Tax=Durusdinium trenchii TaxID=1381693 RepID=A0ABP0LH55_9DINO